MLQKDIKRQKRIGQNIMKAKGKRGYVGKMFTTVDLLKGKEKREYKKAGKLKVDNVYTSLLTYSDLMTYTKENQKNIVQKWLEVHKVGEIQKALGISHNQYYDLLVNLGLKEPSNYQIKKKSKDSTDRKNEANPNEVIALEELKQLPAREQLEKLNEYNKKYTAKAIADVWGKKDSTVHQLKYYLKHKLRKEDQHSSNENDQKSEQVKFVAIDPVSEEESDEQQNLIKVEESKSNIKQDIPVSSKDDGSENVKLHELESLIKKQSQMIEELKSSNDQYKNTIETTSVKENKAPAVNTSNFNMTYTEEKEGFLLHQELLSFLSVLKKNPTDFKVELNIIKTD